ncbi:4Fe-4S dicluster domain-containing protein [Senegalia massiliensis]|nr:reductive dehalogenase domain-containing protein [Senegalia massiliensis]
MKKIDERDTMFSRMNLEEGSKDYNNYYNNHPEKKEKDDEIRNKPEICGEGTATYDPINSKIAEANFKFLNDIKKISEGIPALEKVDVNSETITRRIKGLSKHFGAVKVGITRMRNYHWYSNRGRDNETYGDKVNSNHKYGIVFAVKMDKEMLNRSPQVSEIIDTSNAYVKASIIGMQISYFLRELGYEARNHMDANYLAVLPLVARDAGIGDIGRNGIIITKEYGQMIRLGLITTNIPLIEDEYKDFGLNNFCERCNRCLRTCPGKAIPKDKKDINGINRWQINQEDCYNMWRILGTDCGICISSCPFSQGVDIENIKSNKDIDEALKEHDEKYGIRPYIRTQPEWLK